MGTVNGTDYSNSGHLEINIGATERMPLELKYPRVQSPVLEQHTLEQCENTFSSSTPNALKYNSSTVQVENSNNVTGENTRANKAERRI